MTLVRVTTPGHDHPREFMVFCRDHLADAVAADDPPLVAEVVTDDEAKFFHVRCQMCSTEPSLGRACANDACRRALHPRWPAVYCSNACALDDL